MDRRTRVVAAPVAACCALMMAACSSAPSSTDPYHGTWTGTIVDRTAGGGSLRVELRASGGAEGSWTATVGTAGMSGTLAAAGSVGGERGFAATCRPQGSMLWVTSVSGNALTGTYVTANCGNLSGGSLDLRRQ